MSLRDLPSVEQLLSTSAAKSWLADYGRPLTVEAIRTVLNEIRSEYKNSKDSEIPQRKEIQLRIERRLQTWIRPSLNSVINATGVLLHTNLGRAPLSQNVIEAIASTSTGYSNLEFDLASGKRGSRLIHAEQALKIITGAEAALVVNNNAAAVLLVLTALAKGKRVIIPRSQLVEIGGGFRVPDVMRQSGAKLVEVGTTNKLKLSDFLEALEQPAGMVMRVHRSNFKIVGFAEEPPVKEIVRVTHSQKTIFVDDLGSGALLDTAKFGLEHEPMVQESIANGADVVCFSGDKLIGGPQAGIIVGREELISKIKKHPLARALRADKLCLAALMATLQHYLKNEAESSIPLWQMMSMSPRQIKATAEAWVRYLGAGKVVKSESTIGGGSLPGETLPSYVVALDVKSPVRFSALLRSQKPAVVARIENDKVLLDPRTVLPDQEDLLLSILNSLLLESS